MKPTSADAWRGAAVYSPLMLRYYDFFVLRQSNSHIWRCPTFQIENLYRDCVSMRHCDIGVGSGYFLDGVNWPARPTITLVDLNPNSLTMTERRISRYRPARVCADVLGELPDLPHEPFESAALNYLFHCLPGGFPDKARQVFANVLPHVKPGGQVFGSSLLSGGVHRSRAARGLMWVYNRTKIFHNSDDDLAGLEEALRDTFADYDLEVVGCVAMFRGTARGPMGPRGRK